MRVKHKEATWQEINDFQAKLLHQKVNSMN
ncbi:hypothetical protein P872_02060 [Rhodonellum psychrophilum GCM71 = DSM 17998]|uniref:Uncharacterized protein n=1 Tax=Rhodonellum psychrophilum GCM71 = DSM 17998 TaxID=1123057 RepID=U5C205_9BACT|nr:hypothetical protein P872_02060 [Rhodonellum psychrophilum GCM71 = DSM 17998]